MSCKKARHKTWNLVSISQCVLSGNLWEEGGGQLRQMASTQDTWSEDSHEKLLTLDKQGVYRRQTKPTHNTWPWCTHIHNTSMHTPALCVCVNLKSTPWLAAVGQRRCLHKGSGEGDCCIWKWGEEDEVRNSSTVMPLPKFKQLHSSWKPALLWCSAESAFNFTACFIALIGQ